METSIVTDTLTDGSEVHAVAFRDGSQYVHLHCEDRKSADALQAAIREYVSFGTVEARFGGRVEGFVAPKPASLPFDRSACADVTPEQGQRIDVLAYLAAHNGAVLYWQVPIAMQPAFARAHSAGSVILNDNDDCYAHPDAIQHRDGSYSMPTEARFAIRHTPDHADKGQETQCTLAELLRDNAGDDDLCAWARNAYRDEKALFGGGAAPDVLVRRIA